MSLSFRDFMKLMMFSLAACFVLLVSCENPNSEPSVQIPPAPGGVQVTSGDEEVTVTWDPTTGSTSYNLYWSTSSGVTAANGTRVAGVSSPHILSGLSDGTTYYFVVTAVNSGGESLPSVEQSATPQVPAPGSPTGISATAGNAQSTISWSPASGATSYNLYWSTSPGVTIENGTRIPDVTSPYTMTGLVNGTPYYWIVTAVNAGGEVASTQVSSTPQVPAPGAPSAVSATAGNTQSTIRWWTVNGATSYNLYWSTSSDMTIQNGIKIPNVISPYTMTGLVNGTPYYWSVTAVNAGGEAASTQVTSTPQVPAPGTPTGVSANGGDSRATISWASASGATSYNLYWSTESGVNMANGTIISNVSSPYVHTGLTNGTPYYWIVTAVNAGGETASGQVTAVPQVPAPVAPAGLSVTGGNAQATVSWPSVTGATSYNLYWSTASGVTRTNGTQILNVSSPFTKSGLSNGTLYYWIVTAVNAGGESPASAQQSARPIAPPASPLNVSAASGTGQVTISWNAVSGATSYNLYYGPTSGVTTGTGVKLGGVTSPYIHSGLGSGATNYYIVTAVNASGESAASAQVVGQTSPYWQYLGTPKISTGFAQDCRTVVDHDIVYMAYSQQISDDYVIVKKYGAGTWSQLGSSGFPQGSLFDLRFFNSTPYVATKTNLMKFDGTAWVQVGPAFSTDGSTPSLAFRSDGTPYIAYSNNVQNGRAVVLAYDGTSWNQIGGAVGTTTAHTPSLVISPDDVPYLAFVDSGNVGVFSFDGTAWNPVGTEGFFESETSIANPSLAFDSSGVPFLAFSCASGASWNLAVWKFSSGSWSQLGESIPMACASGLVIDPAGVPSVLYYDWGTNNRYSCVSTFNGASWVGVGLPDFSGNQVNYCTLAVDSSGTLYAGFQSFVQGWGATVMTFQ